MLKTCYTQISPIIVCTWIIFQNFEKFIKFHEKIEVDFLNSRFILGGSIASIYNTENSPYKFQWYTLIHLIYILSIISNQKKYSAFRLNMHFFTRPDLAFHAILRYAYYSRYIILVMHFYDMLNCLLFTIS